MPNAESSVIPSSLRDDVRAAEFAILAEEFRLASRRFFDCKLITFLVSSRDGLCLPHLLADSPDIGDFLEWEVSDNEKMESGYFMGSMDGYLEWGRLSTRAGCLMDNYFPKPLLVSFPHEDWSIGPRGKWGNYVLHALISAGAWHTTRKDRLDHARFFREVVRTSAGKRAVSKEPVLSTSLCTSADAFAGSALVISLASLSVVVQGTPQAENATQCVVDGIPNTSREREVESGDDDETKMALGVSEQPEDSEVRPIYKQYPPAIVDMNAEKQAPQQQVRAEGPAPLSPEITAATNKLQKVSPCEHGMAILIQAQIAKQRMNVTLLAKTLGLDRRDLYSKVEFAPLREVGRNLFGLFAEKGDRATNTIPHGSKSRDGTLEAHANLDADPESRNDD